MKIASHLDAGFVNSQRAKLVRLRQQLLDVQGSKEREERGTKEEFGGEARSYEDDADRLTAVELDDQLIGANQGRLISIDRALQKIEDGTYGLSDKSSKPIAPDRLAAVPEATLTLEEQRAEDAAR